MSLDDQPQPALAIHHLQAPARAKTSPKKLILGVVALGVVALAATYGRDWWTAGRFMVSTDDAYVQGNIAQVSAKIQGYVSAIAVAENQKVAAGDVLLRLDDGDYKIALDLAQSRIGTQTETLKRIEAQTLAARAAVEQAVAHQDAMEAALRNAQTTADRLHTLVTTKSVPQAQVDTADADLDQARADLVGAKAAIASAEAHVAVMQAQYAETQSGMRALELAVQQAQRNLDLTALRAPYAGTVTHLTPQQGDLVSPGQVLGAIVPTDDLFIEANFKETQLAGIAPGATARITVDGLPGQEFEGHVTSISPATGAMFSLLPAQNATGNFTKVVQRVPVRISLPAEVLTAGQMRAGLSVVVDVDSRTAQ